jgi:DNA-binding MarR family transcriptional regulator
LTGRSKPDVGSLDDQVPGPWAAAFDVGVTRYEPPPMCQEDGYATGWEVIVAVRRFQHRLEVFIDQSLEPVGITFAQYRALEVLDAHNEMHVSYLARLLRLSRQAAQATIVKLDRGGLVDLLREPGRLYVKPSELGVKRLRLFRAFTADFKSNIEEQLTDGQRHRIVELLQRADRALDPPRQPEWWLEP